MVQLVLRVIIADADMTAVWRSPNEQGWTLIVTDNHTTQTQLLLTWPRNVAQCNIFRCRVRATSISRTLSQSSLKNITVNHTFIAESRSFELHLLQTIRV